MTNSGRASALAATDAAMPTLRRLERAAIAAATPITYHSKYGAISFIIPLFVGVSLLLNFLLINFPLYACTVVEISGNYCC